MNERNLTREILKIESVLRKYAFSQVRRYFLKGDLQNNAEDIYSHVYLKFFSRFIRDGIPIEEHKEEFIDIIENNKLERYLKVAIRNRAYDMKELEKNAPTDQRVNSIQNEDGDYTDPLDIISDDRTNAERDLYFRKILELFNDDLDETEAEIIYYKFQKNMTFEEISTILQINSNTLRTKVNQIRLKNSKYKDLTWD